VATEYTKYDTLHSNRISENMRSPCISLNQIWYENTHNMCLYCK